MAAVESIANAALTAVAIDPEYKQALAEFEAKWGSKTRNTIADHEHAWNATLSAGWTANQLRRAQVPEPGKTRLVPGTCRPRSVAPRHRSSTPKSDALRALHL